jgi:uncharacterized membrane protein
MSSNVLAILLPYLLVTLFCVGCLTAILKTPLPRALLGLCVSGWSIGALIAISATLTGEPEGLVLALFVFGIVTLCTLVGLTLVDRLPGSDKA